MIAEFAGDAGLPNDVGVLQAIDLEYHNVDPDAGLYRAVEHSGAVRRIVSDADILGAVDRPPADTRAFLRGMCISRFGEAVRSVTWSGVSMDVHGRSVLLDMSDMVDGSVAAVNARAARAANLDEFLSAVDDGPAP